MMYTIASCMSFYLSGVSGTIMCFFVVCHSAVKNFSLINSILQLLVDFVNFLFVDRSFISYLMIHMEKEGIH